MVRRGSEGSQEWMSSPGESPGEDGGSFLATGWDLSVLGPVHPKMRLMRADPSLLCPQGPSLFGGGHATC